MRCQHCNTNVEPNQRYCGNCGAVVNPQVPETEPNRDFAYEDEYDDELYYEPQSAVQSPSKALGFVAVVLAFLLIFSIIVGAFFMGGKSLFNKQDADTYEKAYREYVQSEVIGDNGMFRSETAHENADGVFSVNTAQLDKEEGDELIVAYSETVGNRINTRIACYEYNEEAFIQGESTSEVELVGIVTPVSEPNYIENNKNHTPNEKVVYTFTYKGDSYIAMEYIAYNDTACKYECHIYELAGGALTEHSKFTAETDGSTNYDAACLQVKNFFAGYGIERNNFVIPGDYNTGRLYTINCGADTEFLFRYCFYRQGDGIGYKDIYGYDDYSTPHLIY